MIIQQIITWVIDTDDEDKANDLIWKQFIEPQNDGALMRNSYSAVLS